MSKRFEFLLGAILMVIVLVPLAACSTNTPQAAGNTHSATTTKNSCPPAPANCDLIWDKGPVQHQPTAYAIFWGQQWDDKTPHAAADKVLSYFRQVGGTSYANILSQYYDAQGYISNQLIVGDSWIDDRTAALPVDSSNTCQGKTITDSALQNEIDFVILKKGWPMDDPNTTYFVYTPPGYAINTGQPTDDATSPCSNAAYPKGYCGYHNFSSSPAHVFKVYAEIVYPRGDCSVKGQDVPVSAQDNAGQTLAEVTAHEQFEAATDPYWSGQGDIGWQDVRGGTGEISDKCAWKFPPGSFTPLGSASFALSLQWSNASHSCVDSYAGTPPPRPSSYPSLAFAYQGTAHNLTVNVFAPVILTDIVQDQQTISGNVFWGPGLVGDGSFTGTIDTQGNATFTDTFPDIPTCCSSITFTGKLAPDGSFGGTYTTASRSGLAPQQGVWQTKPYQPASNPSLGAAYHGTIINLTVGGSATFALTDVVQNDQAISGNVVIGPGLGGSGTFLGTIASDGRVSFTDTATGGGTIEFRGLLFPDGSLNGVYVVPGAGQMGIWQTTPG